MHEPKHALEQFWQLLLAGDSAKVAALFDGARAAWDDPIFNGQAGDAVAAKAIPQLASWLRDRIAGGADAISHFRTTLDDKRIVVESVLGLRDGVIWNQASQSAEPAANFDLAVSVIGDLVPGATNRYSAVRIYFGTWSVLKGAPKVRLGPIAPDERAAARKALDAMPVLRKYFECLAVGNAEIVDLFETDGYFREPANNYACGRDQLKGHFVNILKLGGVGVEFLTATRQDQCLALELQTITWGTKKMDKPQAGFAVYELGLHGKICGSRVYDSVVPPAF